MLPGAAGSRENIAHVSGDPSSTMIAREFNCDGGWFWGWDLPISNATNNGKFLFQNLLYHAVVQP